MRIGIIKRVFPRKQKYLHKACLVILGGADATVKCYRHSRLLNRARNTDSSLDASNRVKLSSLADIPTKDDGKLST